MDDTNIGTTAVADGAADNGGVADSTAAAETTPETEGGPGGVREGAPEGGGDTAPGEGGEVSDEEALGAIESDGRRVDVKNREAFAKLAKVDQNAARAVREMYFRAQAFIKEAGAENASQAIQNVKAMRATIDSLGGDQGINDLQEEVTDYRREIQQFAEGDPGLLQQLYESSPEGVVDATRNSLELLADKDMKLFDKAIMGTMVARLERAGMYNSIQGLLDLIKEGKGQEAYDLTMQIQKWLNDAKGLSSRNAEDRERARRDPRAEENERRARELDDREAQSYDREISVDVNRVNNRAMAKIVDAFFKDIGLQTEGRREFVNTLQSRIWRAMKEDKGWQRQAHAIKDRGDVTATAEFISHKFAEMLPDHFRMLRNSMYPNYKSKPKPKPNGAAQTTGANGVTVTSVQGRKPNRDDIDWKKTSQKMFITGKAVLKNGKNISWDWKTV